MKKMIALLVLFSCLQHQVVVAQETVLPPAEFEKNIQTIQPQLLDVRTAREYQSSHLKNALQADWLNQQQFAERTQYLDKTKPVYVYCASGARSAEAAKWLLSKGFTNVQNLKGGISAWKVEGRAVEAVNSEAQMPVSKYTELSRSADIVLVDVGAEWCPPCKKMEPVLKQLQEEAGGRFSLVKVDGGIDVEVMKSLKVEGIPVFIVYKNGKEVWRKTGVVELKELKTKLFQ